MKISRRAGATSQILQVFVRDSSSTTGAGLTGLTSASSGLVAYYHRDTDTTATAISLVTMTVGTFTSSGFKEIDSANMPGWYQFCPPNAALASGAASCGVHLKGAANMAPLPIEIDLDSQVDVYLWNGTAVASPATAGIPDVNVKNIVNVAAAVDLNNFLKVDVEDWKGRSIPSINVNGVPVVDVAWWNGVAVTAATAGIPDVNVKNMNNVAATSITTVNANIGETQPINFTGTGGAAQVQAVVPSSTVVASVSGAVGSVTARVTANSDQFAGQTVTAATGVTLPASVASPTNITAGIITTATNLTNAPTAGDFTAAMKTSLNAATPASVTGAVGSVTGNVGGNVTGSVGSVVATVAANLTQILGTALTETAGQLAAAFKKFFNVGVPTLTTLGVDQTGDSFARLGVAGVGLTNLGDTRIANLDATVSSRLSPAGTLATVTNLTNAPTAGDFTAAMKTSLNAATPASVAGAVGSVTGNVGGSVGSVTAGVTVTTNNDKSGYALSSGGVQAIWDALTSALVTVGSIGKLLAALPGSIWDVVMSGHTTSGTTGAAMNGASSAGDPWATALPGAYGAGTAGNIVGTNLNATVGSRLPSSSAPSNFAALGITAGGKVSGVALVDTLTTYTGNTPQTGDSFARLGAPAGASVSADIASRLPTASISLTGGAVTVGTNNDKAGYALTSAYDPAKTAAQPGDAMALTSGERATLAGVVWANATRTLSSVGTLVADIATAVWGAATRTLSAFGLTVTTDISGTVTTNLDATVSSRLPTSGYSTPPTAAQNADALLGRNLAGGSNGVRTVQDALRPARNKVTVAGGVVTVYAEDDTTVAWTGTLTTDPAAEPITAVDPA